MDLHSDFRELLELFIASKVEFVVVGGYALAHHGAPRFTGDIDLFVRPTRDNADRIVGSLNAFGFASVGLNVEDFVVPDQVVQLGVPPVRVDLLTSLSGVTWDETQCDLESFEVSGLEIPVIGRASLIANKRASGRTQDLADLEALGEA